MVLPSDGLAQEIVDELARRVGAPVLVEDPAERVVAYSAQEGLIDQVRRDCILARAASPEVVGFFARFELASAAGPFRTPSQPELGVLGRLCVPIRRGGSTLGYLWLIDDEARLGADDEALAVAAAGRFAALLHDLGLRARLHSDAVGHLLSPSPEMRDQAARQLVADGRWPASATCTVGVVQVGRAARVGSRDRRWALGHEAPAGDTTTTVLAEAAERWRKVGSGEGVLAHVDGERVAVVSPGVGMSGPGGPAGDQLLEGCLLGLRRHLLELVAERRDGDCRSAVRIDRTGSTTAIAGIGDRQTSISGAAASYRHARLAARVAGAVPALGGVGSWSELGAYRALVQIPPGEDGSDAVDPRLEALLASGRPELVETLETYLDRAGDVKATAEQLVMHRGGLYYRLGRIEEITGCDLRDGADRLALHLGLRLARLQGRRGG